MPDPQTVDATSESDDSPDADPDADADAAPADQPAAPPTDSDGSPPRSRRRPALLIYTLPGAWVALVFVCLSFTPSLLPRTALVQGVVCGINGALGYAVGVLGAWVWRQFADRGTRPTRRRSWQVFTAAAVVALVVSATLGWIWQQQLRDLMGIERAGLFSLLWVPIAGAVTFVLLVALGRGVRKVYRWLATLLSRWMGARAARAVGWSVVTLLIVGLVSGVLLDGLIRATDNTFSLVDTTTPDGAVQPTSSLRSGGPGSLVSWESLGFQGRRFTGTGPTAAQIGAFTGTAAIEPIRIFAGVRSVDDLEQRAELAADDLVRAGGLSRKYVLVVGTTGTGWVDPASMASLEYETGGDIASIAIQYSYLPSWASVSVDRDRAAAAGRAVFEAVYEKVAALPAATRPKLLITGESLGSFSIESAFSGEFDLRNRVAGALLSGPPNFNPLHRQFTDDRDAGSTEVEPVYRSGRTIRFTNDPSRPIQPVDQPWSGTRVLYLQNPSDPVVWLSTSLAWQRPDWLAEPSGRDVLPEMTWIPMVTFWQVTIDMLEPVDPPSGHGHIYSGQFVDGWAAVIQPEGWTTDKAAALRSIVAANFGR